MCPNLIPKLSVLLSSASHLSFLCLHSLAAAAAAKSLQSCPTLCDPTDISPPGSTIPGILQARTLEWVAISFSNAWKWKVKVKLLSKCPTLRDLMDCSLPGSPVHGIFQARVLEWVAIAFSDILANTCYFLSFYSAHSNKYEMISHVVLICISLMFNDNLYAFNWRRKR